MRIRAAASVFALAVIGRASAQTPSAQAAKSSNDRTSLQAAQLRALVDAAQATAKAARENVDYARTVPDLLFQILAKLDKIESKLDKVETTLEKSQVSASRRQR
jgi:GTP-binding protein EngB required for normal cell division